MKKGSYQPGQSPGRGGVGSGEDKALSVGKEKELGKADRLNQRDWCVSGISEKEC